MTEYDSRQLDLLTPDYLRRLGLSSPPFTDACDPRFFYADPERARLLELIQHLAQYSELLLIVRGPQGSGKTALLEHLLHGAGEDWRIARIHPAAALDPEALVRQTAEGFGLSAAADTVQALHERLYAHLAALQRSALVPLLVIDDAHTLAPDALEAVLHLADAESGEGKLLRTVLFCAPAIEQLLCTPRLQPLRERITHSVDLPALDEEDTAGYIRHRLRAAGFTGGELPLAPRSLHAVYKTSGGIPARINEAAHAALSGRPLAARLKLPRLPRLPALPRLPTLPRLTGGLLGQAGGARRRLLTYAGSGLAALLIILLLVFQDTVNSTLQGPPSGAPRTTTALDLDRPLSTAPQAPALADVADVADAAPAVPVGYEPPAPAAEAEPPPTLAGNQPAPASLAAPAAASSAPVPVNTAPEPPAPTSSPGAKQGAAPQAPPDPLRRESAGVQDNGEQGPTPRAAPAPRARLHDRRWIASRPGDHYTLQLLATSARERIPAFLDRHHLHGDAAWFEHAGRRPPLYALVLGDYPSRTQAQTAAAALPESLRGTQPWLRRFSEVQTQLPPAMPAPSDRPAAPRPRLAARAPATAPPAATPPPAPVGQQPPPARLDPTAFSAWLWARDPRHYTLQLLGTREESAARRFIERHELLGKAAYLHTRRAGKDWYVVVYGVYPDHTAARAAIQTLPKALRGASPWPRRFSSLHAEVAPPGSR